MNTFAGSSLAGSMSVAGEVTVRRSKIDVFFIIIC